MKAGRELDALVAERVMGWKTYLLGPDKDQSRPHIVIAAHTPFLVSLTGRVTAWQPSTSIGQAMEVAERIHEYIAREVLNDSAVNYLTLVHLGSQGWAASFGCCRDTGDDRAWYEHVGQTPYSARAATAPLAISLAALAACGVEVPE
jgi:hypothetical protein